MKSTIFHNLSLLFLKFNVFTYIYGSFLYCISRKKVSMAAVMYCLCPSDAMWQEQMQLYQELVLTRLWPSMTSLMWQIIEWEWEGRNNKFQGKISFSTHFCIYWPFLLWYTISYPDLQLEMAAELSGALLRSLRMLWTLLETDFIKQNYVAWHLILQISDIFNCSSYNSFVISGVFLITF